MIDASTLIAKLQKIDRSDYNEEALAQFGMWIKQIEETEALRAVAGSFIIQDMMKRYKNTLEEIDTRLKTDREINDIERKLLFNRKDLAVDFIQSFDADQMLEKIAREIENLYG